MNNIKTSNFSTYEPISIVGIIPNADDFEREFCRKAILADLEKSVQITKLWAYQYLISIKVSKHDAARIAAGGSPLKKCQGFNPEYIDVYEIYYIDRLKKISELIKEYSY